MGRWNREDLAWVAGIIEGEGHVRANWVKHSRTPQLLINVSMTDLDILERLRALTGFGNITGPRQRLHYKPIWSWQVSKNEHCYALLIALWPWFGLRRKAQVKTAISTWLDTHREVGLQRNSCRGRESAGFCRRGVHTDPSDAAVQSNGRGHYCRACSRQQQRERYHAAKAAA